MPQLSPNRRGCSSDLPGRPVRPTARGRGYRWRSAGDNRTGLRGPWDRQTDRPLAVRRGARKEMPENLRMLKERLEADHRFELPLVRPSLQKRWIRNGSPSQEYRVPERSQDGARGVLHRLTGCRVNGSRHSPTSTLPAMLQRRSTGQVGWSGRRPEAHPSPPSSAAVAVHTDKERSCGRSLAPPPLSPRI
jgi:hypothetical protein